ncbi:ABC-type transport auxiliary lipoprotein family protein [Vreelandella aquamarina]|uniref:ABC-type transport auxiliary lipoprotein family protein n=1 Tax=Vreelandella aquamarina TaxID=77097 RepID=UPI003850DADB
MKTHSLCIGFLLSALLALPGCSILPENTPATLYRLPAATVQSTRSTTTLPVRLGIATPEAGHLLSSNRIVVFPEGNVVNVYEGARWHEDAPDMLQTQLIAGLQQRKLFANVSSDRLPHDLRLLSALRHFQSEYDNTTPPSVNLQLDVQLVGADQQPVASTSFAIRERATSKEIPDVVNAFGSATDRLTEQLASWLATHARD